MTAGNQLRVYEYVDPETGSRTPLIHISAYAVATHHNITTIRTMLRRETVVQERCEGGAKKRRPLKYFRDGTTVWIPVQEITGYPFVKGTNVYHYTETGERYLCTQCTFTNIVCDANKAAIELKMPQGDL